MDKITKLVTLILGCIFCALVAFWWVRLQEISPPIVPIAPIEEPRSFDPALQIHLFGTSPTVRVAAPSADIRLAGVIAPDRDSKRGIAILALESKPMRAYRSGEEIAPGIRLLEVHPRRVLIGQNGVRSEVALPPTTIGIESQD